MQFLGITDLQPASRSWTCLTVEHAAWADYWPTARLRDPSQRQSLLTQTSLRTPRQFSRRSVQRPQFANAGAQARHQHLDNATRHFRAILHQFVKRLLFQLEHMRWLDSGD